MDRVLNVLSDAVSDLEERARNERARGSVDEPAVEMGFNRREIGTRNDLTE